MPCHWTGVHNLSLWTVCICVFVCVLENYKQTQTHTRTVYSPSLHHFLQAAGDQRSSI